MLRKDKPETLIQLLASYRQAKFPDNPARLRSLAVLTGDIAGNCAVTIHFTERRLRRMTEDNEEAFTLCAVQEEAERLRKKCAALRRRRPWPDSRKEVASLRLQYDNFTGSIRHMVGLLDPSLEERLDGIL